MLAVLVDGLEEVVSDFVVVDHWSHVVRHDVHHALKAPHNPDRADVHSLPVTRAEKEEERKRRYARGEH